jgi:hypothetical protein
MLRRIQQLIQTEENSQVPSHIRLIFMPWYFMDVIWLTDGITDRFWVFKQKFKLDRGPDWMDVEMSASEFIDFMNQLHEKRRHAYRDIPREPLSFGTKFRHWRNKIRRLLITYI